MSTSPTPSGERRDAATPDIGVVAPGYRLPAATRLGPVELQVADLARSEEFYARVLGLEPAERQEGGLTLRAAGGREPLLELKQRPGARPVPPRGRIGLFHYAILVPNRPALARFVAHARAIGLRLGMSDHLVSEAVYFSDPDGLGIEVYADRPRDAWRWKDGQLVMATHPLDRESLLREAGDARFGGVPAETRIGHVHLHVREIDQAARFYHQGLGLDKTVWNYPGALFLSAGGYHHHLGLNTWAADAPAPTADDAHLLSWRLVLPHVDDVERATRGIESVGGSVRREGNRVLAVDPWGTAVELAVA